MLVKLNVFLSVTIMTYEAAIFLEAELKESGETAFPGSMGFLFVFFLGVYLIVAIFHGFLDLHAILHSPFGPRLLDVNHEAILYRGLGKTIDFWLCDPPTESGDPPMPDTSIWTKDAELKRCSRPHPDRVPAKPAAAEVSSSNPLNSSAEAPDGL